jgi:hypothetical protein
LSMEPILNPLWVFLVMGEVPGRFALIGSTLVLGAVTARAIVSARTTADDASPIERSTTDHADLS